LKGPQEIYLQLRSWTQNATRAILHSRFVEYLKDNPALYGLPYWVCGTLTGLMAVVYGRLFHQISELAKTWVENHPITMYCFSPLCFLFAAEVVFRFARGSGGSGIGQVKAAIELETGTGQKWIDYFLSLKVMFAKILSSLVCVLGGGALGPEGPMIQISACIFNSIGGRFRRIWPQIGHQSLIIAGGAAGIAAAFNTPLGGLVFALEELSQQHFNRFKTVLISAVIVAGLVTQGILGPYLFFGYPIVKPISAAFLPWAIFVGVVTGLSGGFFGKLVVNIGKWVGTFTRRERLLFTAFAAIFMVTYSFLFSPLVMGGGTKFISEILFQSDKHVSWGLLIGRFIGPVITYTTGVAGGLFAPSLAGGAVIGAKLAELGNPANANLMILLGMIGFLSGMSRGPFTAFVIVLEMTDRHSAIFPMMATSLVASAVSLLLDTKSLYEHGRERCVEEMKA
jgi:H+/Cl- antiporter ClcA